MAAHQPANRLALDSNVLLDLANGADFAATLIELASERLVPIVVPPTVVLELSLLIDHPDTNKAGLALNALQNLRRWNIQPFDLTSVEYAIVRQFVSDIIFAQLLPSSEVNDARILAETAVAGTRLLVSSDSHLLSIPIHALNKIFAAKDISEVTIMSPKRIVQLLLGDSGTRRG